MAVEYDLNTFEKCKHSLFAINVVACNVYDTKGFLFGLHKEQF